MIYFTKTDLHLTTVTDFTDDDFMRIWKGLFYCMWMADKPLVQVLETGEDGGSFVNT